MTENIKHDSVSDLNPNPIVEAVAEIARVRLGKHATRGAIATINTFASKPAQALIKMCPDLVLDKEENIAPMLQAIVASVASEIRSIGKIKDDYTAYRDGHFLEHGDYVEREIGKLNYKELETKRHQFLVEEDFWAALLCKKKQAAMTLNPCHKAPMTRSIGDECFRLGAYEEAAKYYLETLQQAKTIKPRKNFLRSQIDSLLYDAKIGLVKIIARQKRNTYVPIMQAAVAEGLEPFCVNFRADDFEPRGASLLELDVCINTIREYEKKTEPNPTVDIKP